MEKDRVYKYCVYRRKKYTPIYFLERILCILKRILLKNMCISCLSAFLCNNIQYTHIYIIIDNIGVL